MRIDIHGLFGISGLTAPMEQSVRMLIHDLAFNVLSRSTAPVRAATIALAESLEPTGGTCRQCELVALIGTSQRFRAIGTGRTLRQAVSTCLQRAACLDEHPPETSSHETTDEPGTSAAEVTPTC